MNYKYAAAADGAGACIRGRDVAGGSIFAIYVSSRRGGQFGPFTLRRRDLFDADIGDRSTVKSAQRRSIQTRRG